LKTWLRLAVLLAVALVAWRYWPVQPGADAARYPVFLPPEAIATLTTIEHGGRFAYDRDGSVFQNRERRLPRAEPGYYREYTVPTPGAPDRGARRIVAGGNPPEVFYYTDDHYRTFRRVEIAP